jgi:hypothetical protein
MLKSLRLASIPFTRLSPVKVVLKSSILGFHVTYCTCLDSLFSFHDNFDSNIMIV